MSEKTIYPRSPREMMDGWVHLPRFIDKIRLHLAGKLAPGYQPNFTKGFDGWWLQAAGVDPQQFIEVVRQTITDGEVCDWVATHVKKSSEEKAAFSARLLQHGRQNDTELRARLQTRKADAGLAAREDVQCFVDFIDADEKRI
jgi:hypothetical protein